MSEVLNTFIDFMDDENAPAMYIVGVAGTGKTTSLADILQYCIEQKYVSVTCAYTHKAVGILRSKLPKETDTHIICTLHKYLKKRPTINTTATKIKDVEGNSQVAIPDKVDVLFIDEFSMIGEKDYVDIADLQYANIVKIEAKITELHDLLDTDELDTQEEIAIKKEIDKLKVIIEGDLVTKVVYIGDPNQLPPVKDMQTIVPGGKYCVTLTHIHRQKGDNPLIDTLMKLNDYINDKPAEPLVEHTNFIRNTNIVEGYKKCKTSKIILAYTNACVEELNAKIQGKIKPEQSDEVYTPTIRQLFTVEDIYPTGECDHILNIKGDIVQRHEKFKTLETLESIKEVEFFALMDTEMRLSQRAAVFGHSTYLLKSQELAKIAVDINRKIELKYGNAKEWADKNWADPLAKERAKAWREYLSFKNNVICLDFKHAMTIHKSQGSTYKNVFLDIEDIGKCADQDYKIYLKLLYVAISRASDKVYTS